MIFNETGQGKATELSTHKHTHRHKSGEAKTIEIAVKYDFYEQNSQLQQEPPSKQIIKADAIAKASVTMNSPSYVNFDNSALIPLASWFV